MNSQTRAVLCVIAAALLLAACGTTVLSDTESKMVAGAPSADITSPAATLQPDEFDAPAPVSVAEAQKAAAGGDHAAHGAAVASPADPYAGHEVYTCPMHPEVRSAVPGKCPKCGMTLVQAVAKKEK